MKRLLGRGAEPEEPFREEKEPISQRWVIIIVASVFGGTWMGSTTESLALALAATFGIVSLLHSVMR